MIRLGCLPYLNVKPLIYPFEHDQLPEDWELVYEPPSTLARMLGEGTLDAAPVSSFAVFANPKLSIVPGICIASRGAVDTVLMLSKVPVHQVKTVALDTSSLTGASLLKIVLKERYGVVPTFVSHPPMLGPMLEIADAALMIGNPAMLADKSGLYILDLGLEWFNLFGLPMVFAVWAGPKERITPELIRTLHSAKDQGISVVEKIAKEESVKLGVSEEVCFDYLTERIKFDLGPDELDGLRVFALKAYEHRLVSEIPILDVVEDYARVRVW